MKILKKDYKGLMIIEAEFIYSKRHNINNKLFIGDVFLSDGFDEIDDICSDLRFHRVIANYTLKTITDEEYDMCVEKFGNV